jgi:cytochrome P450
MDTTGTTLGHMFYALAKNREVLDKLLVEVNSYENL